MAVQKPVWYLLPHCVVVVLVVCLLCVADSAVVGAAVSNSRGTRSSRLLDDTPIEAVGRCRVRCMKEISIPRNAKSEPKYFKECWDMCENWYRLETVFRPLCGKTHCTKGCQTACYFWNNTRAASGRVSRNVTWSFPGDVLTATDQVLISMSWPRPIPHPPLAPPHPIVYTLLMRQNNDAWQLVDQTYQEQYVMPVDKTFFVPEFLVQAIDDTGLIASRLFHVSEMIFSDIFPPGASSTGALEQEGEWQASEAYVNRVNLTHTLTYDPQGEGLRMRLTWAPPPEVARRRLLTYEVLYILKDCGIYPDLPKCSYAEDLYTSIVPVRFGEQSQFIMDGVYFNTRYEVRLTLVDDDDDDDGNKHGGGDDDDDGNKHGGGDDDGDRVLRNDGHSLHEQGELAFVHIDSRPCSQPSPDFRHCFSVASSDLTQQQQQPPTHGVTSHNVTGSPANVTVTAVSDGDVTASGDDGITTTGAAEKPLTELIRDIMIELLPAEEEEEEGVWGQEEELGGGGGGEWRVVEVNVSWTFLSDPSKVNFSLTLIRDDDTEGLEVQTEEISGATACTFRLRDNAVYELVIELKVAPDQVSELDRGGNGRSSAYFIQDSRQRRLFNTSLLQLAARRSLPVRMSNKGEKSVNHVIISVTCVALTLALLCLAVVLYKKRHRVKDLIVPRATVSKSNSYKSSVGGKTDYSNQLMVFCDEWELDPAHLKFSTPIGQGAFGIVVTGYYSDHKVAIKIVKEGAPLSYKEDLVAEINLMKRLGSHPNIVCLVGACTVSEPIALVMEFVPYGNLQNFLKRCRLEGDLHKRPSGPSEIQYSMLQGCGGIENGVITPTDMLSFARQVAMAMEYLTEKRYVHRDLAARNVLLHYNKVVKVCDFGLSRDIFHDDKYTKLTNGKLPLKWMAIESLRDRVFTTQSDVWSFGILLWEIVTMGASPYPSIALADLYYVLSNNYRMDKTSNCSDELYAVMRACWEENPADRPSFTELRDQLETLMAQDRDYLALEDIDVPLSASDSSSNPTMPELFSSHDLMAAAVPAHPGASCQLARQAAMSVSSAESTGSSASGSAGGAAGGGASASAALLRPHPPPVALRRPPMTIDVCIHQKSTEHLMRPSESDSSP